METVTVDIVLALSICLVTFLSAAWTAGALHKKINGYSEKQETEKLASDARNNAAYNRQLAVLCTIAHLAIALALWQDAGPVSRTVTWEYWGLSFPHVHFIVVYEQKTWALLFGVEAFMAALAALRNDAAWFTKALYVGALVTSLWALALLLVWIRWPGDPQPNMFWLIWIVALKIEKARSISRERKIEALIEYTHDVAHKAVESVENTKKHRTQYHSKGLLRGR
jgi:hypothetical protein